jgi:phage/plasmid-associated DNA primase
MANIDNSTHIAQMVEYVAGRGISPTDQERLGIRGINHAEAVELRFCPKMTSPFGGIYFENPGAVPTLRNWYPDNNGDGGSGAQAQHLLQIKGSLSSLDDVKVPKYIRTKDSQITRGYYDPYRILQLKEKTLPDRPILFATEDLFGVAKAALKGERLLSAPGVWCGYTQAMDKDEVHSMKGKFCAFLGDSDALTNPAVMYAIITTGYDLDCKVGCFPSPGGEKVGLDEYLDSIEGDWGENLQSLICQQVRGVEDFVKSALPEVAKAVQLCPNISDSQKPLKVEKVYCQALSALAKHLPSLRVLENTYGELFGQLNFTQKQLQTAYAQAKKDLTALPDPGRLAQALLTGGGFDNLRYDIQSHQWYQYAGLIWQPIPHEQFKRQVSLEVRSLLKGHLEKYQIVTDTMQVIQDDLGKSVFTPRKGYLPFRNCVIGTDDLMNALPQSPKHDFRYVLPRAFTPGDETKTPIIDKFLVDLTNSNSTNIEMIKCFASALLRGHTHHQIFLQLVGDAGSGKGTLTDLLSLLIGESNKVACNLKRLCTGRFEAARIDGKRLVVFDDVDAYSGDMQPFLSLTGGAALDAERKGVQGYNFKPEAMVVMSANKPMFLQTHPGIARRSRLVTCHRPMTRENDPKLLDKLGLELAAFTLQLLTEFDDERIEKGLSGQDSRHQQTLGYFRQLCQTDGVADWANANLVIDPEGTLSKGSVIGDLEKAFGSYHQHCIETGKNPLACNPFQASLKSIFKDALRVDLTEDRLGPQRVRVLVGTRLRRGDEPTLEEQLEAKAQGEKAVSAQTQQEAEDLKLFYERLAHHQDWNNRHRPLSQLRRAYPHQFNPDGTAKILTVPDEVPRRVEHRFFNGASQQYEANWVRVPAASDLNLKLICDPNSLRVPIARESEVDLEF